MARWEHHSEMAAKRAFPTAKSDNVFGHARKPAKMFRAGLYARVSTSDQQTLPMQSRALREYAARRGWTVAMQVREVGSGSAQRQARERLLEAARRRELDVVLVWRLYFDALVRMFEQALKTIAQLSGSDRNPLIIRLDRVRVISHNFGYGVGDDMDSQLARHRRP